LYPFQTHLLGARSHKSFGSTVKEKGGIHSPITDRFLTLRWNHTPWV